MTIIETPRLRLQPFDDSHIDGLHAMNADVEVMRYLTGCAQTRDETAWLVGEVQRRWRATGYSWWSFLERDSGEIVGAGCVQNLRRTDSIQPDPACPLELGWRLRRDRWRRGLATEAAFAMAEFAFHRLRIGEIYTVCHPENTASASVIRRLGMQALGRDTWYGEPMDTYRMTAAQWATRDSAGATAP